MHMLGYVIIDMRSNNIHAIMLSLAGAYLSITTHSESSEIYLYVLLILLIWSSLTDYRSSARDSGGNISLSLCNRDAPSCHGCQAGRRKCPTPKSKPILKPILEEPRHQNCIATTKKQHAKRTTHEKQPNCISYPAAIALPTCQYRASHSM
jgi:hypothetical protein